MCSVYMVLHGMPQIRSGFPASYTCRCQLDLWFRVCNIVWFSCVGTLYRSREGVCVWRWHI